MDFLKKDEEERESEERRDRVGVVMGCCEKFSEVIRKICSHWYQLDKICNPAILAHNKQPDLRHANTGPDPKLQIFCPKCSGSG